MHRAGDGAGLGFVHAVVQEVLYSGLALSDPGTAPPPDGRIARGPEVGSNDCRAGASPPPGSRRPRRPHRAVDCAVRASVGATSDCWPTSRRRTGSPEPLAALGDLGDPARRIDHLPGTGRGVPDGGGPGARAGCVPAGRRPRPNTKGSGPVGPPPLGLGAGFGGFEVGTPRPRRDPSWPSSRSVPSRPCCAWVLSPVGGAVVHGRRGPSPRLSEEAIARPVTSAPPRWYALAGHCDVIAGPRLLRAAAGGGHRGRGAADRPTPAGAAGSPTPAVACTSATSPRPTTSRAVRAVADGFGQPLYRWYVPCGGHACPHAA